MMRLCTVRTLTSLVVASLVAIAGTNAAQASPNPRTRGDAQAVFQAGFTGGTNIILLHNADANGAPTGIRPTGDPEDVRLYPLAEEVVSYCGSGWHVLNFNTGDSVDSYDSRKELVEHLASVNFLYEIDGALVETERTALKHELFGDGPGIWWFSVGALLPPGSLTVGIHELATTFINPDFGSFTYTVDFNVLPC